MNDEHIKIKLLDVFAEKRFSGNGLTVFSEYGRLSADEMQTLTREMRQYESIFLMSGPDQSGRARARIFTMEEELDFAGHPLLGLAAVLHENSSGTDRRTWTVDLNRKSVVLHSICRGKGRYLVEMDQGRPEFMKDLNRKESDEILKAAGLTRSEAGGYLCSVVSTGLPYIIVPLIRGLEDICFSTGGVDSLVRKQGAEFIYFLDVNRREARTWDNEGRSEDIATGSAAGPAAAWLWREGLAPASQWFEIHQGRFLGRPSVIDVCLESPDAASNRVLIRGQVICAADIILN